MACRYHVTYGSGSPLEVRYSSQKAITALKATYPCQAKKPWRVASFFPTVLSCAFSAHGLDPLGPSTLAPQLSSRKKSEQVGLRLVNPVAANMPVTAPISGAVSVVCTWASSSEPAVAWLRALTILSVAYCLFSRVCGCPHMRENGVLIRLFVVIYASSIQSRLSLRSLNPLGTTLRLSLRSCLHLMGC